MKAQTKKTPSKIDRNRNPSVRSNLKNRTSNFLKENTKNPRQRTASVHNEVTTPNRASKNFIKTPKQSSAGSKYNSTVTPIRLSMCKINVDAKDEDCSGVMREIINVYPDEVKVLQSHRSLSPEHKK